MLLLIPWLVFGQSWQIHSKSKKAVKYYQIAETAYKERYYLTAEKYLKKAIDKDNKLIEAWLLLGDVHAEMEKQQDAIYDFQQAIAIDSTFFPPAFYFLGNLNYDVGNYSASVNYYKRYLLFHDEDTVTRIMAAQKMKTAAFAADAITHPVGNPPENTGDAINTEADEYINFVNENHSVMTFTRKEKIRATDQRQVVFRENFYRSSKASGEWETPVPVVIPRTEGLDKGGMSLSIDGRKMYFTGCNWPEGMGSCDLYVSQRRGLLWQKPVNLGRQVNSSGWDSQPVVSADGKRLFFASRRKGGKGRSDIYM